MRIALVSKADARGGGAGRVADDLHAGFASRRGYASTRYTGHVPQSTGRPGYERISTRYGRLRDYLKRAATASGYIDYFPVEVIGLNPGIWRADVVHFHDLSTVFAPRGLLWISYRRPVIWTVHDESAMTAGCIYPLGCRKYLEGCGNCPQLGEWPLVTHRDRTAAMERERRHVMKAGRIHLIAPSEWMRRQIHAKHPDATVEVIYNGVDTSTFSPLRRSLKVGVATTRSPTLSVLFVANYSREVRKGSLYIPEIIEWLRDNDRRLRLVIVGEAPRTGVEQLGPLKIHSVGHIATRERLAELYANVDAVLMLSHADNCPLVVLEALACGTPVFAFATGGIPELVDANSGALSSPGALAELLVQLFDRAEAGKLKDMSTAARERAERHYTMSRFIGDHADYYGRVVSSVR